MLNGIYYPLQRDLPFGCATVIGAGAVAGLDVNELLVAKWSGRSTLDEADRAAVRALPIHVKYHQRHARLVRQGDRPSACGFIVEGCAVRCKITHAGARQIVALLLPGDLIDVQQIVLPRCDHDVEALTALTVGDIPADRLQALALTRPAIGRAIWTDLAVEGSIMRELLLNNSRRNGVTRLAHQLCEFAYRLDPSSGPVHRFDLPLTQEQLGDMTGLTGVHVNRVLRMLRQRGLVTQSGRTVRISDLDALARLAGFSPAYLHLDAGGRSPRPWMMSVGRPPEPGTRAASAV